MTPNRSTAVMQRRAPAPDALDYFPTPPWAVRALCERLILMGILIRRKRAWEPACGEMHMARPLMEYFEDVRATDVHQYGNNGICDFLALDTYAPWPPVEWIITNPPFLVAEQFIATARRHATEGVAMLVRSSFTESVGRYHSLFGDEADLPSYELQFAERVVMLRGRLIQSGAPDPFNLDPQGKPRPASSATSYSWLVWMPGQHDWKKRVIPPCRTALERAGDYPEYPEQWTKIAPKEGGLFA
ncbi:methyltransferase [Novosphingobium sp. SG707]|uniref:methyltransferase n=1 Tax=Novosphingobium sp. SG707 TaxID=2586996 RepID=UPI0014489C28|nr:methyltransferase [Novosphingobium sp. SG707]NKI99628.1 hypothetical protein [Novosphingobium sp. SG707]